MQSLAGCLARARTRALRRSLPSLALGLLVFALWPIAAEAGALRANIFLTQEKIPATLSSARLLGFMRSRGTTRLRESTETKLEERKFMAEMVTQFNAPPGDLEFHVLFYDIHGGSRQFVEDMSVFINDRTQKMFLQRVKLPRPRFKPNRRMELVVTVKRAEVGSLKFITDGEEVRHSGTVDFSDGER